MPDDKFGFRRKDVSGLSVPKFLCELLNPEQILNFDSPKKPASTLSKVFPTTVFGRLNLTKLPLRYYAENRGICQEPTES